MKKDWTKEKRFGLLGAAGHRTVSSWWLLTTDKGYLVRFVMQTQIGAIFKSSSCWLGRQVGVPS